MMKIRLLTPAEIEMLEAAIYYEMQAPGLGGKFLDILEAAITGITEYPETWPEIDKGIRSMINNMDVKEIETLCLLLNDEGQELLRRKKRSGSRWFQISVKG